MGEILKYSFLLLYKYVNEIGDPLSSGESNNLNLIIMEKIKGIRGCYNQSEKVYDWLVNHGWKPELNSSYTRDDFWDETKVFHTIDGHLYETTSLHHVVKLLDVEEILPWRADRGDTYYFVSDFLEVCEEEEHYYGKDESRWKSRNYFADRDGAMVFLEKILAVRKELKM